MIDPLEATAQAGTWALTSPGNVNWALLQDFASVSLDDMTHLARSVIEKFYGKAAKCKVSLAQSYPNNLLILLFRLVLERVLDWWSTRDDASATLSNEL